MKKSQIMIQLTTNSKRMIKKKRLITKVIKIKNKSKGRFIKSMKICQIMKNSKKRKYERELILVLESHYKICFKSVIKQKEKIKKDIRICFN